jgi:hypothetical protein
MLTYQLNVLKKKDVREKGRLFSKSGRSFEPVAALETGTRAKPPIARTFAHIYMLYIYCFICTPYIFFVFSSNRLLLESHDTQGQK